MQPASITHAADQCGRGPDLEVTETQAAQIELDKTAEQFRALHEERQHLIKQVHLYILDLYIGVAALKQMIALD